MNNRSVTVCGREFSPELLLHLQDLTAQDPPPTRNQLAKEACSALGWYSPDGRPSLSGAKVALRKLDKRQLLRLPPGRKRRSLGHRLKRSSQPLSPLENVPKRVDRIKGLSLHLLSGHEDPMHARWNDLIIDQHPLGDAPLVGTQLRYLIGSEHGWLGALGFGPAAFVLGCRDQWIGWSTSGRLAHLPKVIGLSRLLIRQEVNCMNLVSKVLSMVCKQVATDWQQRYGVRPVLIETFVDRSRFNGCSMAASNWQRVGESIGRGRLGPKHSTQTTKDVWVYPLDPTGRQQLQQRPPAPLTPCPLLQSLARDQWCARELKELQLGDQRRNQRAVKILQARWEQPQSSFYGSFTGWSPAKGAYGLIENPAVEISLAGLLSSHQEQTQTRMAAENIVLLPQDTTALNYTGLQKTVGLGPLGDNKGRGLWLHTQLSMTSDGIPLGVLEAKCWARPEQPDSSEKGRNAKSIDEKESVRWLESFQACAQAAGRMPQTKLINISDREGDMYELYDAVQQAPTNLHVLVRAKHNRILEDRQKLWDYMASLPAAHQCELQVPRRRGQPARTAILQVHWGPIRIQAPAVGPKKNWPDLPLWAVWVHEPDPPKGAEPIEWMLLTDLEISTAEEAKKAIQWYCKRWGIEEWHRTLKTGCSAEQREFKTAEHLQRVLAFDLIIAWRVLACVKLGRALPQLPANVIYTPDELKILLGAIKKKPHQ